MEVSTITKRNMNDELVNENIRFKEVLVIGPNGDQLGKMMRREALEKAYEIKGKNSKVVVIPDGVSVVVR